MTNIELNAFLAGTKEYTDMLMIVVSSISMTTKHIENEKLDFNEEDMAWVKDGIKRIMSISQIILDYPEKEIKNVDEFLNSLKEPNQ